MYNLSIKFISVHLEGSSYSGKGGIFCVQVDGPITEGLMSWEGGGTCSL